MIGDGVWCSNCSLELDEPSYTPVDQRLPCPRCGSKSRKHLAVLQSGFVVGSHMSSGQYRGGELVGFSESEGRGRVSHADLQADGTVNHGLRGRTSAGEDGTLETCATLVAALNERGSDWIPPHQLSNESHVDGIATSSDGDAALKIQVVRAIPDAQIWQRLRLEGRVAFEAATVPEISEQLRLAISRKLVIPAEIRQILHLALNARETPAACLGPVIANFKNEHGEWARLAGFDSIWVVGLTTSMVSRLA